MNQQFERLLTAVVNQVEQDPRLLFAPAAGPETTGVEVAAVAGNQVIDLINRLLEILTRVAGEEKEFFLKILFMVLCPGFACTCLCDCMCCGCKDKEG